MEVERERVQDSGTRHKTQTHLLQKEIAMLHNVMTDKDDIFLDMKVHYLHAWNLRICPVKSTVTHMTCSLLKVRLERERNKTRTMEQKLKDQEDAVTTQAKAIEKWETKAAEQAKQLEELQKIRKVLLIQLKEVRDSVPKKDHDLVELKERLQELDQEYGKGMSWLSGIIKASLFIVT